MQRHNHCGRYPTQLPLGDGVRTLIVGGYANGETGTPTPSIEIFDFLNNTVTTLSRVPELVSLGGLILNPIVIQLPWTDDILPAGSFPLLLFGGNAGQVMFASPDNQVNALRDLPPWPTPGFVSALSAAGGHTLLTLEPENGYAAELAMFGGTTLSGGEATPLHRATMPRRLPGSCAP
ncbi:hypothetical protein MNEG_15358 [Monoraphidium neglectum]|uniref:Uncharacterized protein n=1 Tax=Monoraphidium neglectum TaxID=145388 RepID=A0A0D2MBA0_9CHLO|nr:hypothetical protein MNEG_15358 [Monoraphidium neglectum]KIY92605.1 hypothetical protein MNEG_15358 [Monoraphidium neglectum]|eukprot:XP_013891625.1 hypothetical protein MNEG_15358 [Monoraphidium neglectum]